MRYLTMAIAVAVTLVAAPRTGAAQATAKVERQDVPVSMELSDVCNDEIITLSGYVAVTTRTTVDGQGVTHVSINTVPHVSGSSPSADYTLNGADREHNTIDEDGTTVQSVTSSFVLIGQGKAPNYKEKFNAHLIYYPDGSLGVQFFHTRFGCV